MQKVIALDPKHANALNYLGYTYADLGRNLDEAERLVKEALKYKPNDGYITDSLGWVYYKKGQAFTLHKPGEIIGYTSLVAPFYYTSTCVSLTEGELILLSRADFYRLVQINSMLSNKIIEEINKVAEKRQYFTQHMND